MSVQSSISWPPKIKTMRKTKVVQKLLSNHSILAEWFHLPSIATIIIWWFLGAGLATEIRSVSYSCPIPDIQVFDRAWRIKSRRRQFFFRICEWGGRCSEFWFQRYAQNIGCRWLAEFINWSLWFLCNRYQSSCSRQFNCLIVAV